MKGQVEDILADPKINDPNEKSNFWLLAAALDKFIKTHSTFPVAGILPDITSTTEFFLNIQKMYTFTISLINVNRY